LKNRQAVVCGWFWIAYNLIGHTVATGEGHGADKIVRAVSLLQLFCWKNMRDDPNSHVSGSMVNRIGVPSWNFDIQT